MQGDDPIVKGEDFDAYSELLLLHEGGGKLVHFIKHEGDNFLLIDIVDAQWEDRGGERTRDQRIELSLQPFSQLDGVSTQAN